jgi:hypothetical protein
MRICPGYVVAAALIALPQSGSAQSAPWLWQHPRPQGHTLAAVHWAAPGTAFAVGEAGTILRSTDSAHSWQHVSSGTTADLKAVAFTRTTYGVAAGESGSIVRTVDGGTTWNSASTGTTARLRGVAFADVRNLVAVGDAGTILRSADGGSNWAPVTSGTRRDLRAVVFADGWGSRSVTAGRCAPDGGVTWTGRAARRGSAANRRERRARQLDRGRQRRQLPAPSGLLRSGTTAQPGPLGITETALRPGVSGLAARIRRRRAGHSLGTDDGGASWQSSKPVPDGWWAL